MEKEMKDLQTKLKDYKLELIRQRGYMAEHGFAKEQAYINDKIDVAEQIIWEIDDVLEGNKKGIESRFSF